MFNTYSSTDKKDGKNSPLYILIGIAVVALAGGLTATGTIQRICVITLVAALFLIEETTKFGIENGNLVAYPNPRLDKDIIAMMVKTDRKKYSILFLLVGLFGVPGAVLLTYIAIMAPHFSLLILIISGVYDDAEILLIYYGILYKTVG